MNHITCVSEVLVENGVLTADRLHISDSSQVFTDPGRAILDQGVMGGVGVSIGAESCIVENASVLSCKICKHCVVGANAVVMNDIPDFSVAVGVPAQVVRKFDSASRGGKES
jgi:acetyltransferase-like isoleucine patch superfamily enzyme